MGSGGSGGKEFRVRVTFSLRVVRVRVWVRLTGEGEGPLDALRTGGLGTGEV